MSIKNEQDRREETPRTDVYKLVAGRWIDKSEQSAQILGSARANSVIDQPPAAQAVYTSNINSGSFIGGNLSAASSEQQSKSAPTSQPSTTTPQANDFSPGTNVPPAEKPMLGKLPRGYTYEQLWYRTWYGWGSYNSAQQQEQH